MSRCLVTGCGGFIGSYLADALLEEGHTVFGTVHRNTSKIEHLKGKMNVRQCDTSDQHRVADIVREAKPDYIFHLAARSLIMPAWQDPETTLQTNILGTLHLLEGTRKAGLEPLIEVLCSSAEYGFNTQEETPIKEDESFKPCNPYGVSKIGQDMLSYLYWRTYGMQIIRVRPFYIVGPGKTSDACSDFARGIVNIEQGRAAILTTGNLESVRDLVDVRDCVAAMILLAQRGLPGEVYNICSGRGYQMQEILDRLISLSRADIKMQPDPKKIRPADSAILVGDNTKLRKLGWMPQISLESTLTDILNYWREKCRS